jgi:hypothetical protein
MCEVTWDDGNVSIKCREFSLLAGVGRKRISQSYTSSVIKTLAERGCLLCLGNK